MGVKCATGTIHLRTADDEPTTTKYPHLPLTTIPATIPHHARHTLYTALLCNASSRKGRQYSLEGRKLR
ncbi:hypothetical protein E2C01_041818 [Portunus trituberculatus]|uniref:Uncharacterized protein n=1 Tax=Portunus trituberculatus TaxID=210409 RepID=A0A5B7FSQ0_PORTR|nr:hypothetical protein [Portunus trituberculatus]